MKAVEAANPELRDVLPWGYQRLALSTLTELLRQFSPLPRNLSGDAFGLTYEDFLSNYAMAEGRLGGGFFTPYPIVRLVAEIIEPFYGKVYDPACGSGGMFRAVAAIRPGLAATTSPSEPPADTGHLGVVAPDRERDSPSRRPETSTNTPRFPITQRASVVRTTGM